MKYLHFNMQIALTVASALAHNSASCGFADSALSTTLFSSGFKAPTAPMLSTEISSSFIQHKYDEDVSHITSGYWYNSPSAAKVRVDEAYAGAIGSSLFDYADINPTGAVKNHLWLTEGSLGSSPSCFADYVAQPAFPLLTKELLVSSNATYGGMVNDPWVGQTQSWNLLYAETIPVIVYLQNETVVVGYDFWSEFKRTKVITRFFNIKLGSIDPELFENFPC